MEESTSSPQRNFAAAVLPVLRRATAALRPVVRERGPAYGAMLAVAVVAHGLRLLNDGIYWDTWILYSKVVKGDWAAIHQWCSELGLPLIPWLFWFATFFGSPTFGFAVVSFGSILLGGVCVYEIARETDWLSRVEALWVAVLTIGYPSFQADVAGVLMLYRLCFFLLLLGFVLALHANRATGRRHWVLRIAALLILCTSFTTNSMLVVYFPLLLLLVLQTLRNAERPVRALPGIVLRHLDYLVIPFAFWMVHVVFFKPHGDYGGYHAFKLDPSALWVRAKTYLTAGFEMQLRFVVMLVKAYPVLLLAATAVAIAAFRLAPGSRDRARGAVQTALVLAFGFVFLAMGIFPYVAVGESATPTGWWSRHTLLMGLPISLLIVTATRPLLASRRGAARLAAHLLLSVLLVGFTSVLVRTYVSWQARWVKDKGFIQQVAKLPDAKQYSIFWVDDRFPVGPARQYGSYEWTTMVSVALGSESYYAMDARQGSPATFKLENVMHRARRENYGDVNPAGAQAYLGVFPGRIARGGDWQMAKRYLYHRYLAPAGLEAYLDSAVQVRIAPAVLRPSASTK